MSVLPPYSARVLQPHDERASVADFVALGAGRDDAITAVRRGSGRVLRLDALDPGIGAALVHAFQGMGGVGYAGPSAYRVDGGPAATDVLLLGTAGQLEALADRLLATDSEGFALTQAITTALSVATWGAGTIHLGRFRIDLSRRVAVMGILNVTPDSFHDGGKFLDPARAVEHGLAMVEEGADIIDVGGDSANGDAPEIDAEEEIRRVEPVIRALASRVPVPIAIDTHRARTAAAALDAGASLVNDITGLADPEMPATVASGDAGLCIMHIKGRPKHFPPDWTYRNVMGDLVRFLTERTERAVNAGVGRERICVDPGIEFGKLIGHDLEILRRLPELHALGYPILVAASRKTLVGHVLGGLPSSERLEGTAAVNAYAIARGARIVRVHDVRAMARVARMTEALVGMTVDGTPMARWRADGVPAD